MKLKEESMFARLVNGTNSKSMAFFELENLARISKEGAKRNDNKASTTFLNRFPVQSD